MGTITQIYLASDHAGYNIKKDVLLYLKEIGYDDIHDLGTDSSESVDYPDYADKICIEMKNDPDAKGILICGMSISANRYSYIRAALCHNEETAKLSRA